ncbi:hypothetical protein HDU87_000813 [Geranomyces variabilis]|uniref:Bms1-type G domain-containing protein n=1 Tax=Geranomyces variabilis TaxID=109894 RepID=A0AAD5TNA7_9FUNG|nr:hypothetical protein HDU87_000813 [Geranomyces variabilis]
MGEFSHRSGLKQQNKGFKSRHATKGQVKAKTKGKVDVQTSVKHKHNAVSHKVDRKNAAKVAQLKKRADLVQSNRLFNGSTGAPKILAIVPLCPDVDASLLVRDFYAAAGEPVPYACDQPSVLAVERFKQKLHLVPLRRNLLEILDAVKVADFVLFVVSAEVEVDTFGDLVLTTIKAQGVPLTFSAVQHLERISTKKQQDAVRKSLTAYMEDHFPQDAKLFHTAVEAEGLAALRHVTQQRPKPIVWRDRHAYMLAEDVAFVPNEGADADVGALHVKGYVRGNNLSANRLVHIPGHGDYQMKAILSSTAHAAGGMEVEEEVLDAPIAGQQETLVFENEPDPMEGEQTWPTEEELKEAEERVQRLGALGGQSELKKKAKRVPKGTSAYQAAWIVDEADEEDEEEEDEEDETDVTMMDADGVAGGSVDWNTMGLGHNGGADGAGEGEEEADSEEEYEDLAEEDDGKESEFDAEYDADDEAKQYREFLQRQDEERDDLEFPDEVNTPKEPAARVRFQRYRGLKSFRTSPWDPYENLPVDYSRIFQFQNFKRTRRKVLDSLEEGDVSAGARVTIILDNVPRSVIDAFHPSRPFVVFALLPHEHKYSVVNFTLTRNDKDSAPVKSKQPMIIQSGFRRYVVQPLYSTNTRGGSNNVHKFERFLQPGRSSIATVYAPIQFGPAPVLMFRKDPDGVPTKWDADCAQPLIAHGSVLDLDPCRIVSKRVILTGHPFKCHKRGAVIRYMFWNPADIDYFKPVQLVTKLGRQGHIRDTLGTHGYMKCVFDGPLKGEDTVCMYLYKRVFPKWTTVMYRAEEEERGSAAGAHVEDVEMKL